MDIQNDKQTLWQSWQKTNAQPNRVRFHLEEIIREDVVWHGFHPLRRLTGRDEVYTQFWQPLLGAVPDLKRRPYFLIGGEFEGRRWIASTGDFIGTFARDWLVGQVTIPACQTSIRFRYGEFCCVHKGKIVEIRFLIDLPDLIQQAVSPILPASYGRDLWIPGPISGDGILLESQDVAESAQTLELVETMIFGGLNQYDQRDQDSQGLERFWHPHLAWYGPVGIGSAYGLDEFKRNAQGPIVRAYPDRKGVGHQSRIAEGNFAASTGWPSLVGTHQEEFMGWAPSGQKVGWNIMDFWRREGDRLLENWVLIDLIDAALQVGVDLIDELRRRVNRRDRVQDWFDPTGRPWS